MIVVSIPQGNFIVLDMDEVKEDRAGLELRLGVFDYAIPKSKVRPVSMNPLGLKSTVALVIRVPVPLGSSALSMPITSRCKIYDAVMSKATTELGRMG